MNESPDQVCRNCGTAFTGEATGGLCPHCLLGMNLASRTMPGGEATPQLPPPSPEEMADRFPQFEILEYLGRGGMGIVYKARQKALDRLVAIKVLAGERSDDPQFEARFSREARTLAKLSHPSIVTVHDFGESDGMFYLVMEYVDGVNLRDVLSDGRMEPEQALAIVPSICEALQFAHDHGVVHRDIKPENILMDRDGRVKIADFGIATLVGATGDRAGTPPYMAPEQEAPDGTVDHRTDIYALGVVFYEMLTGERPEQDPSRPSQRVEVDVRLDEIVLRALEKEPEQRYQTAGEFRTMVETMAAPATRLPAEPGKGIDSKGGITGRAGSRPASPGDSISWETTAIGLGTVILLAMLAFAWRWSDPFRVPLMVICALGLGICALSAAGVWPFRSPLYPDPNFSSRNTRRCRELTGLPSLTASRSWRRLMAAFVTALIIGSALTALMFWLQRPRLIDNQIISSRSPDEMFNALGSTWHRMRILGGDRSTYRFTVQGKAGAVFERWEIDVPYDKLAKNFVLLALDEIKFGRHGAVVWSEDGKRVSFRVNGVEVSAFNTVDGGHSFQDGYQPQRVVELTPDPETGCIFVDLDSGEISKPSEQTIMTAAGMPRQQRSLSPQLVGTGKVEWMRSSGADLVKQAGGTGLRLLDGVSIAMVETIGPYADPRAFDTIPAERVVEAVNGVEQAFVGVQQADPPLWGLQSGLIQAVRTREGAVALVEILWESTPDSTRLRYKLVASETPQAGKIPPVTETVGKSAAAQPPATPGKFGPVIGRILHDLDEKRGAEALDFHTGTLSSIPAAAQHDRAAMKTWFATNRMHLLADYANNRWALMVKDSSLYELPDDHWDSIRPRDVTHRIEAGTTDLEVMDDDDHRFYLLAEDSSPPLLFAFRTGSGLSGVMEITAFADNPRGVKLRYKLVPPAPAENPGIADTVGTAPQAPREAMLAYARALAAGDFAALEQTWEFKDDLERRFARKLASMFAQADEMSVELVSMQALGEESLFACFLMRNGPEGFGTEPSPHPVVFHRADGRWRGSPPGSLRIILDSRSMSPGQIGRRGITREMITARFSPRKITNWAAIPQAQAIAFAQLAGPPYNLSQFEAVAERMQEQARELKDIPDSDHSWKDSLRRVLDEHGEEALPAPDDFHLCFYLEAKDDPQARTLPFADGVESFRVEPFPCLTDEEVQMARAQKAPDRDTRQISVTLTRHGAKTFEQLTRESIGRRLAIVVGGKVVSAPVIQAPITGGKAVIQGIFSAREAATIVDNLNAYRKAAEEFLDNMDKDFEAAQDLPPPAESPALPEHEVVAVVRRFLTAIRNDDYDLAIGLGTTGEFSREGLIKFQQAFELDQAKVLDAYAGITRAAVLTNTIPARASARPGQFGYSLLRSGDSWRIRDSDFLPDDKAVEAWLAGFRSAEANAEPVTVTEG